jgi:hypothetical protein
MASPREIFGVFKSVLLQYPIYSLQLVDLENVLTLYEIPLLYVQLITDPYE